jgi:hypothetical protein
MSGKRSFEGWLRRTNGRTVWSGVVPAEGRMHMSAATLRNSFRNFPTAKLIVRLTAGA